MIQAYSLNNILEANSIYQDYPLSKVKLSEMLNRSTTHIRKMAKIGFILADYKKDCPRKNNGGLDTTKPLTPYQIWVISRVNALMAYYSNAEQTKQMIRNNRQLFSKERFDQIMTVFNETVEQQIA